MDYTRRRLHEHLHRRPAGPHAVLLDGLPRLAPGTPGASSSTPPRAPPVSAGPRHVVLRIGLSLPPYEYRGRLAPLTSVPGAGGLGDRVESCAPGRQAALSVYLRAGPAGLPRRRDARRRQDDLRAAPRHRAARPRRRSRRSPSWRPPSTSRPSGPTPRRASASTSTRGSRTPRPATASEYDGVALTYAQVASKPSLHRTRTEAERTLVILDEIHHGGDTLSWGDAIREAFEPADAPPRPDGHAVPLRHLADPVRDATRPTATASAAPPPTTPTGMPRRCVTASCGPCSSSPTAAPCAGAPRPATRSRPASASR